MNDIDRIGDQDQWWIVMVKELFWVAFGGALGAMARYVLADLVQSAVKHEFPHGILVVNVLGCLILGFVAELPSHHVPQAMRLALIVGFLGSLTTFSTFSRDTIMQAENHWGLGASNIFLNLVLGIIAVLLGRWLAQLAF